MSLDRLDPRVKLFLLVVFSTSALVTRVTAVLPALLLMVALVLLFGGIGAGVIWRKLRGMFGLIVMLFVLQCLFNRNGEALLTIYERVIVTDVGFHTALLVCLRLLVIFLGALVVAIGEARDYLLALTSLKVPYEIAFMALAALRFLPMLREEAREVLQAAQMRGLRIKKAGLRRQASAYLSIVIPVVAGAIHRSENLSISMEARGFRAFPRRTSMRRLHMRPVDWAYALSFCAIIAAIFVFIR